MRAFAGALALAAVAGCSGGSGMPAKSECMSRCETKGVVCGFPDTVAVARCNDLCAAVPSESQLICIEALACPTLATSAAPCGVVIDMGAPDAAAVDARADGAGAA